MSLLIPNLNRNLKKTAPWCGFLPLNSKRERKNEMKYKILFLFISLLPEMAVSNPGVEEFIREADYRSAVISPNGQYLAELWNQHEDGTRFVTIKDLFQEGEPIVGNLSDRVVRPYSMHWANDERLLLHVQVPLNTKKVIEDSKQKDDFDIYDYYMFSRTVSIKFDGTDPVVLMEDQRRIRHNINLSYIRHFLPNDENHILMTAFKKGQLHLFKVNVNSGESEIVVSGTKKTFLFLCDIDGNPKYRLDYFRVAKRIDIYEENGGDWIKIEEMDIDELEDEEEDRGELVGLFEGDLVYRKKNEVTGYRELLRYNSESKRADVLVSVPKNDVLYPIVGTRNYEIIGYAVDGDLIRYRYFDEERQKTYEKIEKHVGDYNFYFPSATRNREKLIVKAYGQDSPGTFFVYDEKLDELKFLQHSYFGIAVDYLSLPARLGFKSRDGLHISSYLLLPINYKKGQKYPLVVMPHGGPHARDRASYDDFAQFISTRGYIVIKPNFRGSTGYGKGFEEAGYRQWGLKMQDDLEDAVNFLVEKGYVYKDKVCIVGGSYGGYAALMGAVKTPDLYRCAISINGVTDLLNMVKYDKKKFDSAKDVEKYVYSRIGHPKTNKTLLKENSPVNHVDRVKIPLLIFAGTQDNIVPFSQSRKMAKALRKAKKDFEFIKLRDAGHNVFYFREDRERIYTETEKFLEKAFQ